MLNSLRFRLPALFLAGIALSGLVTSLIALRLFQDYTRDASLNELRREARGLAQLYAESAVRAVDEEKAAPTFAAAKLEAATGDRLYFVGQSLSPGEDSGLTRIALTDIGVDLSTARIVTFEFRRPARTGRSSPPRIRSGRGGDRVRVPDRRQAEGGAARCVGDAALPPRDRIPLLPGGRRRARALPDAAHHRARPWLSPMRPTRSRGAITASRSHASPAAVRSVTSQTAFAR